MQQKKWSGGWSLGRNSDTRIVPGRFGRSHEYWETVGSLVYPIICPQPSSLVVVKCIFGRVIKPSFMFMGTNKGSFGEAFGIIPRCWKDSEASTVAQPSAVE